MALAVLCESAWGAGERAATHVCGAVRAPLQRFFQIPGPNPILTRGAEGAWDSGVVEAADAFEDFGTYYLYYHATGRQGYQIGLATASHPLGPFRKHPDNPVLRVGPRGSWDDGAVACAFVLRQGPGRYLMWYSGHRRSGAPGQWSIGLARAASPAGPWQKFSGNPVLKGFGYVGAVLKHGGQFLLYCEHPIGQTGPDYGPLSLAVADRPEGPWRVFKGNPVLRPGGLGEWDAGGFSEAEVVYQGGVFHLFYGGAQLAEPRIRTRERIGYAYSYDGRRFFKSVFNPVARPEREPPAASYSEVHALFDLPLIYLYHTTRYARPRTEADRPRFPAVEDIGVQVLAVGRPFQIVFPVLQADSLSPGGRLGLDRTPAVPLANIGSATLSVSFRSGGKEGATVAVEVYASPDGRRYDTRPWQRFRLEGEPEARVQQTFPLRCGTRFVKLQVRNESRTTPVQNLRIVATLNGR